MSLSVDMKCKNPGCVGSANESGFCDAHDSTRLIIPSNGIGTTLHVIGWVAIALGAFSVLFFNFSAAITLIISGIAFLGFGEIIQLLNKISHVNYAKYKAERRISE